MKKLLLFGLLLGSITHLLARPSVQASNLSYTDLGCTGVTLNWTKGNGSLRLIIARKGSNANYLPVDGIDYNSYSSVYGSSLSYGSNNDNFVVYKGISASVTISSLTPGETYYFTIYEFDYGSSGAEYLISNAPSINITPYKTDLTLNVTIIDSCENSNLFTFTNNSSSNVPDVQYRLSNYLIDTPLLISQSLNLKMKGSGLRQVLFTAKSGIQGCTTSEIKTLKVFPAEVAIIDFKKGSDTVQDFIGNYFEYSTTGLLMPFPIGVSYLWDFGDNTSSYFAKMKKSYKKSGYFDVSVKMNISYGGKYTACWDTINFRLHVRYNPLLLISVAPKLQYEDSNKVYFTMSDTNATYTSWKFGDGDSSINANDTHVYAQTGRYQVRLDFTLSSGKKAVYLDTVEIVKDPNSSIKKLMQKGELYAYPNPARQILYFNFTTPTGTMVKIFSMDGRLIIKELLIEDDSGIDVSRLSEGNYTIQITTPDGVESVLPFNKSN